MTAHRDDSACTGAVVRKPPVKETALGERGAVDLSGLDACCCRHLPAQLLRYGTNVADGGKQLLCNFKELRVAKIAHISTSALCA